MHAYRIYIVSHSQARTVFIRKLQITSSFSLSQNTMKVDATSSCQEIQPSVSQEDALTEPVWLAQRFKVSLEPIAKQSQPRHQNRQIAPRNRTSLGGSYLHHSTISSPVQKKVTKEMNMWMEEDWNLES